MADQTNDSPADKLAEAEKLIAEVEAETAPAPAPSEPSPASAEAPAEAGNAPTPPQAPEAPQAPQAAAEVDFEDRRDSVGNVFRCYVDGRVELRKEAGTPVR